MVHVECYPDVLLASTLGVPGRNIRHDRRKGNVLAKLRQRESGIALVDEDPQAAQPSELTNYRVLHQAGGLRLLEHREASGRRLIVVCPRLEEWLYQRAAACGIDPRDFGLPGSAQDLKKIARYDRRPKFPEFLRRLCQSDAETKQLRQWVCNSGDS